MKMSKKSEGRGQGVNVEERVRKSASEIRKEKERKLHIVDTLHQKRERGGTWSFYWQYRRKWGGGLEGGSQELIPKISAKEG